MRRSVLTNVPSFSSEGEAGRTRSAYLQVSEKKMSCTTRKSSLRQRLADVDRIRVGGDGVFALDVHRSAACLRARRRSSRDCRGPAWSGSVTPQCASNLARIVCVVDFLVARRHIRHGAEVARTLHVVVPAQGIGACAGTLEVAPSSAAGCRSQWRCRSRRSAA